MRRCVIGDDTPAALESPADTCAIARLALLLLDCGILPPARWVRCANRLEAACTRSLVEWLEERTGALRVLRPCFGVSVRKRNAHDASAFTLDLGWEADTGECVTIGPGVAAIDRMHPGLGRTVMNALAEGGFNSMPIASFADQLSICEMCLWGGCSDEREYVESFGLEPEEAEAYLNDVIRRADVLRETPHEVFDRMCGASLSDARLKHLSRGSGCFAVRRIVELVHEIRSVGTVAMVRDHHRYAQQHDGLEFVGFGALARWSESDFTIDVLDRMANDAFQNGVSYSESCVVSLDLGDREEFRKVLDELESVLRLIRCLDELLWLLSASEWGESQQKDDA